LHANWQITLLVILHSALIFLSLLPPTCLGKKKACKLILLTGVPCISWNGESQGFENKVNLKSWFLGPINSISSVLM
jgi:hypothetical protein